MGRAEAITKFIKSYDRDLFCEEYTVGKLCIYRKTQTLESYEINGKVLHYVRPSKHYIFALTHDGKMSGDPVDWGYLPILNRIKASDLWNRDIASEMIADEEERQRSQERAQRNSVESFLLDFRRQFARTFNDVNTQSMEKKDLRRKGDLKHGSN